MEEGEACGEIPWGLAPFLKPHGLLRPRVFPRVAFSREKGVEASDEHQTEMRQDKCPDRHDAETKAFDDDEINDFEEHVVSGVGGI